MLCIVNRKDNFFQKNIFDKKMILRISNAFIRFALLGFKIQPFRQTKKPQANACGVIFLQLSSYIIGRFFII
jgi:hypothetical protein